MGPGLLQRAWLWPPAGALCDPALSRVACKRRSTRQCKWRQPRFGGLCNVGLP